MATKNPQDSTLRNVRAAKSRDAKLEERVEKLEQKMLVVLEVLAEGRAGKKGNARGTKGKR